MNDLRLSDFPQLAIDEEGDLRGTKVRRFDRRMWQFRRPNGRWSFPEFRTTVLAQINDLLTAHGR